MRITTTHQSDWGARAAYEAQCYIDATLEGVAIAQWGVDRADQLLWLAIECGDIEFDIAITREFFEGGYFRRGLKRGDGYWATGRPALADYLAKGRPGVFSQNGVGRFIHGIDLEDPDMAEIVYEDGAVPDCSAEVAAEEARLKQAEAEWAVAEKERLAAAKALNAANKKPAGEAPEKPAAAPAKAADSPEAPASPA